MFPFDLEEESEIRIPEQKEPIDYEIDFDTGKLTGRKVTGYEAIKQWVKIVLSTDRYYFPQYSWNHGSELTSLIGRNFDEAYVKSEVKRMIEEAILGDENINGITDLQCHMEKDRLHITFVLDTLYGKGEVNV